MDLMEADIAGLQRLMADGSATSADLVRACLARIEAVDRAGPCVNAVLSVNPHALAIAANLDEERRAGKVRGPLHGIPVLIKDNIDTGDAQPTTAGSLAFGSTPAPRDAEVVRRLRAAGAVVLGKTNLSEWANFRGSRSSSGWSAVGGQTRNPHVLDRSPLGSSSGSAAAVCAGLAPVAVGTETDGSIVAPASVCGVVGFKPTLGLVSRRGIVPIAHSQDTAGPMARSVADAAILLDAMAGSDKDDRATRPADARRGRYRDALEGATLKGRRLGIARVLVGNDARVMPVLESALRTLREHGAEIVDPIEFNPGHYHGDEFTVLCHEFKADLAKYLAERGDPSLQSLADLIAFNEREASRELRWFGQELMLQAQGCAGLDAPAYRKARTRARRLTGRQGIDAAIARHELDAIVAITFSPAFCIDLVNGDSGGSMISCSGPAAVAGYPHVTVPGGFVHGLPVGVSFFAGAWEDARVLSIAHAFEQAHRAWRPPRFLAALEV